MKIDFKGLNAHLLNFQYSDFEQKMGDGGQVHLARSREDIDRFGADETPVNRVVEYGQPLLVDIFPNSLQVAVLRRRKRKYNGRLVPFEILGTIVDDCQAVFGSPINRYWIIPSRFIISQS